MRRSLLAATAGIFLALAACTDGPTAPVPAGISPHEVTPGYDDYVLPPIKVVAPGGCDPMWWTPACEGGGDCMMTAIPGSPEAGMDGVAGCNDTGGGGGPSTPPPNCPSWDPYCLGDDPPDPALCADGSTEANCSAPVNDEDVACEDLGCILRDPTPAERQRVLDLIGTLRTDGFCGEVRASALALVNRQLQVWDNRVKVGDKTLYGEAPWDYERGGHVMYIYTGAMTAWTIAHEAIHGLWNPAGLGSYYSHASTTPLGMDLNTTAGYCAGRL